MAVRLKTLGKSRVRVWLEAKIETSGCEVEVSKSKPSLGKARVYIRVLLSARAQTVLLETAPATRDKPTEPKRPLSPVKVIGCWHYI